MVCFDCLECFVLCIVYYLFVKFSELINSTSMYVE